MKIGAGDTALFWKDDWNNSIYAESFPRAFSYTLNEDISVKALLTSADLHVNFHLPL